MSRPLIDLDLPLDVRYIGTVRTVSASLAADIGLSVDEIDDFRLALNEAAAVLCDVDAPGEGRLHVEFDVDDRELIAVVSRHSGSYPEAELDELAHRILRGTTARYAFDGRRFELVAAPATAS